MKIELTVPSPPVIHSERDKASLTTSNNFLSSSITCDLPLSSRHSKSNQSSLIPNNMSSKSAACVKTVDTTSGISSVTSFESSKSFKRSLMASISSLLLKSTPDENLLTYGKTSMILPISFESLMYSSTIITILGVNNPAKSGLLEIIEFMMFSNEITPFDPSLP